MKGFLRGALTVSAALAVTKILGALYRVPLTGLIGAEGIGIYQMCFPFYLILLTVSSTGIPSGVSKLIAEGYNAKSVLYETLKIFGTAGLFGSIIMFAFSKGISSLQGNSASRFAYMTLSPSVFIVSIISALRGYFQGLKNMTPTAVSQILEQVVKLVIGLSLAAALPFGAAIKAAACCAAVTVSEAAALVWIYLKYKKCAEPQTIGKKTVSAAKIIKTVFPIVLSSIMLPLTRAADSFLVVNLLGLGAEKSTALYGIYAGGIESLVGVPVAVCYGLAVAGLPYVAEDKTNKKTVYKLIIATFLLGLIGSAAAFFGARIAVNTLYFGLESAEKEIMISLLKLSAVQILILSSVQTTTSVLIALGRLYAPSAGLLLGGIIKLIAVLVLVPNPAISISGVAISDILCYFVAAISNLLYIINSRKRRERQILKPERGAV